MRDPRYAGLLLLAACLGVGFTVLSRSHPGLAVSATVSAVVVLAVVVPIRLPVWRDEKYPVQTAGIALVFAGLVGLVIALIVGFGLGVS